LQTLPDCRAIILLERSSDQLEHRPIAIWCNDGWRERKRFSPTLICLLLKSRWKADSMTKATFRTASGKPLA
jgi:hypothetical protein